MLGHVRYASVVITEISLSVEALYSCSDRVCPCYNSLLVAPPSSSSLR